MFNAQKNSGETSLQTLERVRLEEGIGLDIPMTYAGTLDPMAEGILPILVGEECKEKEKISGLDKEYEVDILFGIRTDSDDILGLIKDTEVDFNKRETESFLLGKVGKQKQKYHRFSHKKINGVPLFELAKRNEIKEEDLPENEIEIYSVEILGWGKIDQKYLRANIFDRINNLGGDFRQKEILEGWGVFFEKTNQEEFEVLKIKVKCSSGTYIRNLVRELKYPSLAFKIKRISVRAPGLEPGTTEV